MLKIKKLNRKNFKYREKKRNSNKRNEDRIKYCKNIVKRNRCAICSNKKKKNRKNSANQVLFFVSRFSHLTMYVPSIVTFSLLLKVHLFQKKKKNHSFQFCSKEHIEIIITLSFINWIIIKNLSP